MNAFLRSAVVAFLVLWLPLQSAAALAMPFCVHMLAGGMVRGLAKDGASAQGHAAAAHDGHHDAKSEGAHAPGHPHGGDGMATVGHVADATAHASVLCDDYGLCHLACASALTGSQAHFMPLPAISPVLMSPVNFLSHTPPLLQRPPLAV